MSNPSPEELALDDLETNPDEFAGEEVTPEHTLDISEFGEDPEDEEALFDV